MTPPEDEFEAGFEVFLETDMLDFVAERLLKLDIKIFLSSAEIFDSAVLPSMPAADKIEITCSGDFLSNFDKVSTVCAIFLPMFK